MMTPMQSLLNRDGLTVDAIEVRPALIADRAAIYRLTENSHRVHFNLDWWTFDNWLYEERPSDAIWLAHFQNELIGMLVAPFDESPVIWLRSIALANGYSADPIFLALLKHARSAWLALGAERVVVLAHPEWVSALTQRLNFDRYNEIVSLRKNDRAVPELSRQAEAIIRPAVFTDVPAIALNDRAAFDTVWWHSEASLIHILKTVSHFVVAVIDDRVVGHAFSDLYGGQGHLIRLVVHPAYQRLGIGEQLLAESLRYQIEQSAYPLTLNTQVDNLASQALYHRYGFQAAGRPVQVMQYWLS
jgi:ribosomal protein S18 acetylase RimI-like enzyme